jgi:GT2 family glycosyltransferase
MQTMRKKVASLNINFNELDIAKDSIRRLLKEPIDEVWLVDNGSDDGSKEYFSAIKDPKFHFISLPKNMGSSVGRNAGIDKIDADYIFLLDSDILYIKGTIAEYQKILDKYDDAFCVGQNSMALLHETGHNGTYDIMEADLSMSENYTVEDWFPMAWTQYGLFKGDLLRKVKFYDKGVFGEAGYGYEDTWLWYEMMSRGYKSLSCSAPIYYHFAHGSFRELGKQNKEHKMLERKKIFEKKWGKKKDWVDLLNKGITKTYRY